MTLVLHVLLALLIILLLLGARALAREAAEQEMRDKEKSKRLATEIESGDEMLAHVLSKCPNVSRTTLQVLHIAATKRDITFNLATERRTETVPYPTAEMDYVQIRDASQLPLVPPSQMALDDDTFYHLFATNALMLPEWTDSTEEFKRLYILLDVSPSMFDAEARMPDGQLRDTWARGVIAGLLVDATRGKAEYLLRTFDTGVQELQRADTPEEAEKLLFALVTTAVKGNGTNIGAALKVATKDIRRMQQENKRETHILLITDGDDQAGITRGKISKALGADVQLHVVLIGTSWGDEHPLFPYVIAKY